MSIFRDLTASEIAKFEAWADANYTPFQSISALWHPVVQERCVAINKSANDNSPKALNHIKPDEFQLSDDGTLDTVVIFRGDEFRFSDTSEYREMDGTLDWCAFLESHADDIVDQWHVDTCTYDDSEAFHAENERIMADELVWQGSIK